MDLKNLDVRAAADEGAELVLEHPVTGDPLEGVAIRVLGADSSAYRRAVKRIAERRHGKKRVSLDDMERQASELMAAVTVSWRNIEVDGEAIDCTEENAIRLYTDYPWIREQVDRFIADRANFFTKSSNA